MVRIFICCGLLLMSPRLVAQDFVVLQELGILDSLLHETSGLALHYNDDNGDLEIWTHNDANNTDSVYSFIPNDLQSMTRIIDLNSSVKDWEDMTTDDDGNFYVGDFGSQASSDRLVLKFPDPNAFNGNSVDADSIRFVYPEGGYSDMEGMFSLGDSLYLFTKAVNPNNNPNLVEGTTYVFRIPNTPEPNGNQYIAEPAGQLMMKLPGDASTNFYRVTAAALSPSEKVMVLLCYERLWIFSGFEGSNFFNGKVAYVEYVNNQKEGIAFINDHEIFISKEGKITANPGGSVPKLFYFNIEDWIDDGYLNCNKLNNAAFDEGAFGWHLSLNGGAQATFEVNSGVAEVDITAPGTSRWHVSLRQKGLVLRNGMTYQVNYKAWTNGASRPIAVSATDDMGGQYHYHQKTITSTPEQYSFEFTMDTTDYFARLTFSLGKELSDMVSIDEVVITESTCICPVNRSFDTPMEDFAEYFAAQENIEATSSINGSNNNITFDAGNSTSLNPGFEIALGSLLEILLAGCP